MEAAIGDMHMDLLTILLIVLIVVLLFGGVGYRYIPPGQTYYGYGIGGVILVVLLILILLRLLGRI